MTASAGRLGNTFLHPAFDYLAIGGGLSLVVTALVASGALPLGAGAALAIPTLVFFSNVAHFAASTVRLYSKPGTFTTLPFLTMALPLLTLAVLTLAIWQPGAVGRHLWALYLTWSPFHYAAQAYGLSVMYCYRSGCALDAREKLLMRLVCLTPFLQSFMGASEAGLGWFVPQSFYVARPELAALLRNATFALGLCALVLPPVLVVALARKGKSIPLISLLVMVSNGIWWVTLPHFDAFVWATVFHGIQYLAITTIFHVREQTLEPGQAGRWLAHAASFYARCLILGYLLFQLWPYAYIAAGFGWAESVMLVVAVINVHHFVVDAYIWRLRRDTNYRVVTAGVAGAVAA
jgi:hypothetical protein